MSKSKGNVVDPAERDGHVRHRRLPLHARRARRAGPRHPHRRRSASRATGTSPTRSGTRPASCCRTSTATIPRSRAAGTPSTADRWIKSRLAATTAAGAQGARRATASTTPPPPSTSSSGTSSATGISRSPSGASTSRRTRWRGRSPSRRWWRRSRSRCGCCTRSCRSSSEEIWQRLPHEGESIMIAPFPRAARRSAQRARRAADGSR